MTRPIPYPADVRAKGWRFEIAYEQVEQSDTWSLAAEVPMAQHALLMMWMVAWTQVPCGSMPNDEALIRAKCKIPPKLWPSLQPILMRGWWLAEDGRLYHDTIATRVREMLEYRRKESERRNRNRAKTPDVPALSRGTDAEHTPESCGVPDTGTGTGTYTQEQPPPTRSTADRVGVVGQSPTKAGEACRAMKTRGVVDVNPSNPTLIALLDKGVPIATFEAAAETAGKVKKGMAYALGIVQRQLRDAADVAAGPGVQTGPWDAGRSSIEAKAAEFGIGPWNDKDLSANREHFAAYTARVRRAVEGEGVPA